MSPVIISPLLHTDLHTEHYSYQEKVTCVDNFQESRVISSIEKWIGTYSRLRKLCILGNAVKCVAGLVSSRSRRQVESATASANRFTVMRRLTTEIRSEYCVVR